MSATPLVSAGISAAVVARATYRPSSLITGAPVLVGSVAPVADAGSGAIRRAVPAVRSTA